MKRLLFVLFGMLVIGGGIALWWFLRDTPEKVLRDGFTGLVKMKSAQEMRLDVARTDNRTRLTSGFSFVGQLDTDKWTRPRTLGVLRVAAKTAEEQDQLADLVVEQEAVAVRPVSVSPELYALAKEWSQDPDGQTFLKVERDPFLEKRGFADAVAQGEDADVRTNAMYLLPALIPSDQIETEKQPNGRTFATVKFALDRRTTNAAFISILKAWVKDKLSTEEYGWINIATDDLVAGSFSLTIDKSSRVPVALHASWPVFDEKTNQVASVRAIVELDGYNGPVQIAIPEKNKDVTQLVKKQEFSSLPTSGERPVTTSTASGSSSTGTSTGQFKAGEVKANVGNVVPDKGTDLFNQYYEQLKRKKY